MYSYYLKRTFVVTNVERLTGFFLQNAEDFQACATQTAHTMSELLVYKPSEKLKVILSGSWPSSNPGEDSLFSCVSSPTCRCSVWPKAAPATEHLPLPPLTSCSHGTSCYLGNLCPSCCFWIQPGCRSKRNPSGVNVPCTAHMGYYLKSLLRTQHFVVGVFI